MSDCTFVSYPALPDLDPDDRIAAAALRKRGVVVAAAVWSDASVDWSRTRLCVLRSTWDYPAHYDAFSRWLDRVAAVTCLKNDVSLVRWNADKFYLRDLERAGVPTVPSAYLQARAVVALDELREQHGWGDAVIKPARGAGTIGVERVGTSHDARRYGQAHLDRLLRSGGALVQPYLSSVGTYAERALIFIDGAFSHAVTKTAFQALLPAGQAGEAPVEATAEEIAVAKKAMHAVPQRTLYSRVDLVRDDVGTIRVLELELIEPSLFFSMHELAASAFADAIVRELSAA